MYLPNLTQPHFYERTSINFESNRLKIMCTNILVVKIDFTYEISL